MDIISIAIDHLLRAAGDPLQDLEAVGPSHPEFARACAVRAATGVLAKAPEALVGVARALVDMAGSSGPAPSAYHADAARAWLVGDPVSAAERYAAALERDPHDLLALRLAQSCYFFLGWHDRLCALADSVISTWRGDATGFAFVRAMASFAYAENGRAERAEAFGRQALSEDPACPMGVHAIAHAFAESGRAGEGARWMREQRDHWAGDSRMRSHNAWHLAMFDLQSGNIGSALDLLDRHLLPASAWSSLDACDATALLWGLTAAGAATGSRWRVLSDAFERRLTPGFWPFVDLHAALAHAAAGDSPRLEALTRRVADCGDARGFHAFRARHLSVPGLHAVAAWARGDREGASRALETLLPLLQNIGGSRVQLTLFREFARDVGALDPLAAATEPTSGSGAALNPPPQERSARPACARSPEEDHIRA